MLMRIYTLINLYIAVHAVYKEHKVVLCGCSLLRSNWFIHV